MISNLLNELGAQYGINIPSIADTETLTFTFKNNIELYLYLSNNKQTLHLFSTVHDIHSHENRLHLFEYLLKFQLMGVKSKNNTFGLSDNGHKVYIFRNFDMHTITPDTFIHGVKSLAITCEHARETINDLKNGLETINQAIPMNLIFNHV
ncbi:type III secretion system chaperone [uncultured Shewanella sp.]|uniref:type III secretion system chaperone n=1 Tax=uncultured Shewanella sp. TaxID=173975 RepID=UPI00260BA0C0|nr:type III secretion system chaperone [uncultured Shewanella sp.]